jgi:hypothetical protein
MYDQAQKLSHSIASINPKVALAHIRPLRTILYRSMASESQNIRSWWLRVKKAGGGTTPFLDVEGAQTVSLSVRWTAVTIFGRYLFSTTWPGSFLGSFFPQVRVFNNFSASFFGSFSVRFSRRSFVFNNFFGSFSKKGILFCFSRPKPAAPELSRRLSH